MNILDKLASSKFRSSFHLSDKMIKYVNDKGIDRIKNHAYDFINNRIKVYDRIKDGKQTPTRQTHPVFIAQHATATCCRKCIFKWHKIPKEKTLDDNEVDYIVNFIMKWIEREIDN